MSRCSWACRSRCSTYTAANTLEGKTAAALGNLLAQTTTLTHLNYGYNKLSAGKGAAADSFAEGLAANQTLTSLDIRDTRS